MNAMTFVGETINFSTEEKLVALFSLHIFRWNVIACPKEDEYMTYYESRLSLEDMTYIRNLMAEGVAHMLVERVTKNTVSTVDKTEPKRYPAIPN